MRHEWEIEVGRGWGRNARIMTGGIEVVAEASITLALLYYEAYVMASGGGYERMSK